MKKIVKKSLLWLFLLLLAFFIWLPADNYTAYPIRFLSNQDTLSGVLNVPENLPKDSLTLLIFVHGDGALPANAHGYYEPIWRHLAAKGVATLAWDKKGVGASQGNWLSQDMEARAQEVRDALKYVRTSQKWRFSKIGVIGFSQGGWVLPLLNHHSKAQLSFMIIVSGAVNWRQQSNYLTTQRLKREGKSTYEIAKGLAQNKADHQFLLQKKNYEAYVAYERKKQATAGTTPRLMTKERYYFAQKNIQADATEGLKRLQCPVFALFGDKDLNVNFQKSASVYRNIFMKYHPQQCAVKTYANATHSLLKHRHFQKIRPDAIFMWKFWLWGGHAFVPGVLDDIRAFALHQKN
ncbi:alpha/beta hydrolase [uncultured Microscilla sp.]|uniref:alpha/beta hydrolase family protein n=1 Tax=uncultured Microscilla sp. TaxID=432653 RepID=UPI0026292AEE|nr:alpha/beta hydrolase [uncultured Microscilla sp.]